MLQTMNWIQLSDNDLFSFLFFFHSSIRCRVAFSYLLLWDWTQPTVAPPPIKRVVPLQLNSPVKFGPEATITHSIRVETWPSSTGEDLLKDWELDVSILFSFLSSYSSNNLLLNVKSFQFHTRGRRFKAPRNCHSWRDALKSSRPSILFCVGLPFNSFTNKKRSISST